MPVIMNKEHYRKKLLAARAKQPALQQKQKSSLIANNVIQSSIFQNAKKIAFYHAVRGEADPSSLSTSTSKQFYLPILAEEKNLGLVFAPINKQTQYKQNCFSIPEPIVDKSTLTPPTSLDLVIMPLSGFDLQGNRIGMGGGYYDRCFSFKLNKKTKPILLGFAFDFQEIVKKIEIESWDIGLDAIATESRLIIFNNDIP